MPSPAFDVVGLGENSVDLVYRLPLWPAPGGDRSKVAVPAPAMRFGGQVTTTLSACAALGLRTAYVGAFGNDDRAAALSAALSARGVDLRAAVVRDVANRHAVILIDESDGERVVVFHRDPSLAMTPGSLPGDVIRRARVLHVDAVDPGAALAAAGIAREAGARVTCDVDRADAAGAALVEAVTIPILAGHVPPALTGETDVAAALRRLRRPHHEMLCATLGARGAVVLHGGGVDHLPAVPIAVVDSTGAGDVFRGAFIAALLRGDGPAAIVRYANAAAAVSCTKAGAMDGVATAAEIEALLAR
jgi:sugar/nucleoside kinase (ribokinase family)